MKAETTKKKKQPEKQSNTPDLFCRMVKSALKVDIVRECKFHPTRRWRFDYAIPSHKIAVEVEGGVWTEGRHTRPKGFLGDIEKYNQATLIGWRLFRVTPSELKKTATLEMLKTAVNGATKITE